MRIRPEAVKKILVVRNDRFGEFLLNIPAFRALKEAFLQAKLIAIVDPGVKELAEAVPFIDTTLEWKGQKHSFYDKLRLARILKKENIDMAIILNPSREFNIIAFLAGIPVRAGYDRKCGFLLTHKIKDEKHLGLKHEVDYNLELVGLVGAKTKDKALSLNIKEDAGFLPDDPDLIAMHPWTSDPIKAWPAERFAQLAKRLITELGQKIVLVGAKEEREKSADIFGNCETGLLNLTGRTTLLELAGILKRCRLLISADSGPVHLSSAVGTPAIVLFRNDLPGKGSKRWGPWLSSSAVIASMSLLDISVDEVFNKAKQML